MKAVVRVTVDVTVEIDRPMWERQKAEYLGRLKLTENDIWHDLAIRAIPQQCEALCGPDEENDWVQLWHETIDAEPIEIEEEE